MNYQEALSYIENTAKFGINVGMQRIERLCTLLGNPQQQLKVIHVAGTNGKGSTTTFISSVLMAQGYRVGIYTSPYIERFTERIRINEDEIGEAELAEIVTGLVPLVEQLKQEGIETPTEFELNTAIAFQYFCNKQVDYVVLEVGLGGRYDTTNIITPMLSVITTISYDHTNILGNTLDKIAYEKAGIIKPGIPVVVYPQEREAMEVIERVAKEQKAMLYLVDGLTATVQTDTEDGIVFDVIGEAFYSNIKINMLGEHQVMNALTALRALLQLRHLGVMINDDSLYKGFEQARWPARFEIVSKHPCVVLDGGHNMQGLQAMVKAAKHYFNKRQITVVCGMLRDKEYHEMMEVLFELTDDFVTVTPDNPRALTSEELCVVIQEKGKRAIASANIEEAVELGLERMETNGVLIFCGSLYMVGAARTILRNRHSA